MRLGDQMAFRERENHSTALFTKIVGMVVFIISQWTNENIVV